MDHFENRLGINWEFFFSPGIEEHPTDLTDGRSHMGFILSIHLVE
jgi:hypothetical protein